MKRYNKFLECGFTRGEARALSKNAPSSVPYMRELIRFRMAQVKHWTKTGEVKTKPELYAKIKEWYIAQGHTKVLKHGIFKGAVVKDVWSLYRAVEEQYKSGHPEYQSPFRKKKQHFTPFRGK